MFALRVCSNQSSSVNPMERWRWHHNVHKAFHQSAQAVTLQYTVHKFLQQDTHQTSTVGRSTLFNAVLKVPLRSAWYPSSVKTDQHRAAWRDAHPSILESLEMATDWVLAIQWANGLMVTRAHSSSSRNRELLLSPTKRNAMFRNLLDFLGHFPQRLLTSLYSCLKINSDVLIKSRWASLDTWVEEEGEEITCKYLQELGHFLLYSDKRESWGKMFFCL